MTIIATSGRLAQTGPDLVMFTWSDDDYPGPPPGAQYTIGWRQNESGLFTTCAVNVKALQFVLAPSLAGFAIGDTMEMRASSSAAPLELTTSQPVLLRDLDLPYTYGPVDLTWTMPRYTTI